MQRAVSRRAIVLFGVSTLAFALARGVSAQPANATHLPVSQLLIETGKGRFPFVVEIAATPADRQQGLMFRRELPAWSGMLFDFERPQPVAMWMKNTLIPLDMLFIDAGGKVVRVAENTEPLSLTSIPAPVPVLAVLELNGGTAARIGIRAGDRVVHPMFTRAGATEAR